MRICSGYYPFEILDETLVLQLTVTEIIVSLTVYSYLSYINIVYLLCCLS